MSKQDQHELPPGAPTTAQPTVPGLSPEGAARRRFARAGVGGSGIIMTLASAPGMATTVCRPPSGFLSGTWASNNPKTQMCYGARPVDWSGNKDKWITYARTDYTTAFSRIFTCAGNTVALKDYTLFQIISGDCGGNDRNEVAKYVIAALLNARANTTPVLTEAKVFSIWNEYSQKLSFTPNAGAKPWSGTDIVTYLKSTMVAYSG